MTILLILLSLTSCWGNKKEKNKRHLYQKRINVYGPSGALVAAMAENDFDDSAKATDTSLRLKERSVKLKEILKNFNPSEQELKTGVIKIVANKDVATEIRNINNDYNHVKEAKTNSSTFKEDLKESYRILGMTMLTKYDGNQQIHNREKEQYSEYILDGILSKLSIALKVANKSEEKTNIVSANLFPFLEALDNIKDHIKNRQIEDEEIMKFVNNYINFDKGIMNHLKNTNKKSTTLEDLLLIIGTKRLFLGDTYKLAVSYDNRKDDEIYSRITEALK